MAKHLSEKSKVDRQGIYCTNMLQRSRWVYEGGDAEERANIPKSFRARSPGPPGTGLAESSGSPRQLDNRSEPCKAARTSCLSQLPGGPEQASHPLHRPTGDHRGPRRVHVP